MPTYLTGQGSNSNYVGNFGNLTNACALLEIQTSPTDQLCLLEVWLQTGLLTNNGNTSWAEFGIGKPAAKGVGVGQIVPTLIRENSDLTDALPNLSVYATWSQAPTIPANFFRRAALNQSYSTSPKLSGITFKFPQGLIVGPSSSLVIWVFQSNVTSVQGFMDVSLVLDS